MRANGQDLKSPGREASKSTDVVNPPLRAGVPFNPHRMLVGIYIPEALARSRSISAGAKLTWGRLARYAGQNGECYPTMKSLGAEIGVGERQAQKYVAELEMAKLIRRVSRFVSGAQTSNSYQFLWHEIFGGGVNDRSGVGANDASPRGPNDHSPKESQTEESQSEEIDPDCLPLNRKNRDSPATVNQSTCRTYPRFRNGLAKYMHQPGEELEFPSHRTVADIVDAAGTHDETELIAALAYLYADRGLKPFTKHGPRTFAWFKTVLQDYFTKRRDREEAANPCGYHEWQDRNDTRLTNSEFAAMTEAIEIPAHD